MKCFKCKEDITWKKDKDGRRKEARYMMEALERPYINLFFHVSCHQELEDLYQFISDNLKEYTKSSTNL